MGILNGLAQLAEKGRERRNRYQEVLERLWKAESRRQKQRWNQYLFLQKAEEAVFCEELEDQEEEGTITAEWPLLKVLAESLENEEEDVNIDQVGEIPGVYGPSLEGAESDLSFEDSGSESSDPEESKKTFVSVLSKAKKAPERLRKRYQFGKGRRAQAAED